MVRLILFVVPLGLDTFAVAAAIGLAGLPRRDRLRIALLMSGFETAMPLVGLGVGRAVGSAAGGVADDAAIALLAAVATWMIFWDREEGAAAFAARGGVAILLLGVSVSLDELAIGFSIGLLRLPVWAATIVIGVQAFLFAQAGLRLGARVGGLVADRAERLAGLALAALTVFLLVDNVAR